MSRNFAKHGRKLQPHEFEASPAPTRDRGITAPQPCLWKLPLRDSRSRFNGEMKTGKENSDGERFRFAAPVIALFFPVFAASQTQVKPCQANLRGFRRRDANAPAAERLLAISESDPVRSPAVLPLGQFFLPHANSGAMSALTP
jgi:hypothetical protein